jgi:hypothetical protein
MIDYLKDSAWQGVKFTAKHVGIPMGAGSACGYLTHKAVCVWKIFPKMGNVTPTLTSAQAAIGCGIGVQIGYVVCRVCLSYFANRLQPGLGNNPPIFPFNATLCGIFFTPMILTPTITEWLGFTFTAADLAQFLFTSFFLGIAAIGSVLISYSLFLLGMRVYLWACDYFTPNHPLQLFEPLTHLPLIV